MSSKPMEESRSQGFGSGLILISFGSGSNLSGQTRSWSESLEKTDPDSGARPLCQENSPYILCWFSIINCCLFHFLQTLFFNIFLEYFVHTFESRIRIRIRVLKLVPDPYPQKFESRIRILARTPDQDPKLWPQPIYELSVADEKCCLCWVNSYFMCELAKFSFLCIFQLFLFYIMYVCHTFLIRAGSYTSMLLLEHLVFFYSYF